MSVKQINVPLEINEATAFNILIDVLDMNWALDEDRNFYTTEENEFGDLIVYEKLDDGTIKSVDYRGELFHTIRKLSCLIFPNMPWRDDYK